MKTQHEMDKTQEVVCGATASEPFLEWKFKLNEKSGKHEFISIELSDGSKIDEDSLRAALKRTTGTANVKRGEKILNKLAHGMTGERGDLRMNEVSTLLPSLRPKDETEAMLLGQFIALQESGMKCLRHANLPE